MVEQGTEFAYEVFISYAEADRGWAEGYLLDTLEAAGVRVHSEEAFRLGVPRLLEFEAPTPAWCPSARPTATASSAGMGRCRTW